MIQAIINKNGFLHDLLGIIAMIYPSYFQIALNLYDPLQFILFYFIGVTGKAGSIDHKQVKKWA